MPRCTRQRVVLSHATCSAGNRWDTPTDDILTKPDLMTDDGSAVEPPEGEVALAERLVAVERENAELRKLVEGAARL